VKKLTKTFKYGDHEVTLETGQIARQASGSVKVTMGDTVVLVTAVGRKEADPGRPFFPLTVTTRKNSMPRAASPADFSSAKGARPRVRP